MIDQSKIDKGIKDKYEFLNETFIRTAKENPKDKIDVEVGDRKQPNFKPQVKVMRWDNEVNLSFRLKDTGNQTETVETQGDKVVWKKGKREAHFYDLPVSIDHPEGGYEFEVVLLEKPATNVVEFTLNTKGLDFLYQPALTEEEIADGASRPENVIGSYAVYASENKVNYVGGKEYKCGKVGHIYRPRIEDANGTKVWGELNVDTENGILSVTIPQDFLDNAVYPVRHAAGLTFGYTSVGATQSNSSLAGDPTLCKHTSSEVGYVTKLTLYTKSSAGAINTKGLVYDDNGGSGYPGVLMGITSVTAPDTTFGWDDFTFSSQITLWIGDWWIGFVPENTSVFEAWDTGSSNQQRYLTASEYTTPSNPFTAGATGSNRNVSIYATYTPLDGTVFSQFATDIDSYADLPNNATKIGQSFISGYPGTVGYVYFFLKKTGSPTGNATAVLYAHSGTFGTSSVPTGAALATSDNFDVSTLTTTQSAIKFTFSSPYTVVGGEKYVIVLEYSGGDASNYIQPGQDASSPTHNGNKVYWDGANWQADTGEDIAFVVSGTPATYVHTKPYTYQLPDGTLYVDAEEASLYQRQTPGGIYVNDILQSTPPPSGDLIVRMMMGVGL